jgi:hypothetical protein
MEEKKVYLGLAGLAIVFLVATLTLLFSMRSNEIRGEFSIEDGMVINMLSNTEYWDGELGQIIVDLRDRNFNSITADCYFSILYPNKTFYKEGEDASGSTGIGSYYYRFQVPDIEGVYEYSATCVKGSKNYTTSKSFHVRSYLNEFELEAQDTVRPGEIAYTGWRSLSGGRKITDMNCSIPGNGSLYNDNESFRWRWYADPLLYRPGIEYNITCGVGYSTPAYLDIGIVTVQEQLATVFNDTFNVGSYSGPPTPVFEGDPYLNLWYNGWWTRQNSWPSWGTSYISGNQLFISGGQYSMFRYLNYSVGKIRDLEFTINNTAGTGGYLDFYIRPEFGVPSMTMRFQVVNSTARKIYAIDGVGYAYTIGGQPANFVDTNKTFQLNQTLKIALRDIDAGSLTYELFVDEEYVGTYSFYDWGYSLAYQPYYYTDVDILVPFNYVDFTISGSGGLTFAIDNFYIYSNLSDMYRFNQTAVNYTKSNGTYTAANWSDGNFSTCVARLDPATIYTNYTIPKNTTRFDWAVYNSGNRLVIPNQCIHINGSENGTLMLSTDQRTIFGNWRANFACWNGTSWYTFMAQDLGSGPGNPYTWCDQQGYIYSNTTSKLLPYPTNVTSLVEINTSELVAYGIITSNVTLVDYFRVEKNLRATVAKG